MVSREAWAGTAASQQSMGNTSKCLKALACDQIPCSALAPPPARIAVCDEAAAALLIEAWPGAELIHSAAPNAADAIELALAQVLAKEFVDVALLDGHYLRSSDAEIFGAPAVGTQRK